MTARPLPDAAPASAGTRAAAYAVDLLVACAVGVVCAAVAVGAGLALGAAGDSGTLALVFLVAAGAALAGMLACAAVHAALQAAGGSVGQRAFGVPVADAVPRAARRAARAAASAAPDPQPWFLAAPPAAVDVTSTLPPAQRAALFAEAPMLAVLTWDDGSRMAVYGRTRYGRNPAVESGVASVPVRDETLSLSKTHFEIGGDATGTWVADRHSTNGTVLVRDGGRHPLVAGLPTALRPGDRLELGDRSADVGLAS